MPLGISFLSLRKVANRVIGGDEDGGESEEIVGVGTQKG